MVQGSSVAPSGHAIMPTLCMHGDEMEFGDRSYLSPLRVCQDLWKGHLRLSYLGWGVDALPVGSARGRLETHQRCTLGSSTTLEGRFAAFC